jgi:hypothetical protein
MKPTDKRRDEMEYSMDVELSSRELKDDEKV